MSLPKLEVEIRPTKTPGVTKAHADVRITLPSGKLELIGFAVIEQPGKKPFVGFPQNRGRNKYFPVVDASGDLRDEIEKEILRAYKDEEK
jgi:hypothetical protein